MNAKTIATHVVIAVIAHVIAQQITAKISGPTA